MPTNTAGNSARQPTGQQVSYLRQRVVFGNNGTAITLGTIPAGSLILRAMSGVQVEQAFNAGTTNTLNIGVNNATGGVTTDDDFYATLLALGTVTFVPNDENVRQDVSVDTTLTATVVLSGTAATTGIADVVIAYLARS